MSMFNAREADLLDENVGESQIIDLPILRTKFYRPSVTPDLEQRSRLIECLDRNHHLPLTLISAPAGYGKTLLASTWLENCGLSSAWLSLDEQDNDPRIFVNYLLDALYHTNPSVNLHTYSLLKTQTMPSVQVLARYLLNDLDQVKEPTILVMDNIHKIVEPIILKLLRELLKHPPRLIHLVVIGRYDPDLQIPSLRARSQVNEIRAHDLRFTPEETAGLLQNILGREIDEATAVHWTKRTEGWVAAIRLAALSLRHRGKENDLRINIGGGSRYLSEFLLDEVLACIPDSNRVWLIKCSLLDRFSASLCEAVCRTNEDPANLTGESFIDWLLQENLFLFQLDDQGKWFRFHHLFRELLQEQLRAMMNDIEISALQKRAGRWHSEYDLVEEAFHFPPVSEDVHMSKRDAFEIATETQKKILIESLTRRERQVINLLMTDLSLREIANSLTISPHTLNSHTKSIYRKLAANKRTEAVERAKEFSLI